MRTSEDGQIESTRRKGRRTPRLVCALAATSVIASGVVAGCGSSPTSSCAGAVAGVAKAGAGASIADYEHSLVAACPDYSTFLTAYQANPALVYSAATTLVFCNAADSATTPADDFNSPLCVDARAADPADLGSLPGAGGAPASPPPESDLPTSPTPTPLSLPGPFPVTCDICGNESTAALTVRSVTFTPIDDGDDDSGAGDQSTVSATIYNAGTTAIGNLALQLDVAESPNGLGSGTDFAETCVPAHGSVTVTGTYPYPPPVSDMSFVLTDGSGNGSC